MTDQMISLLMNHLQIGDDVPSVVSDTEDDDSLPTKVEIFNNITKQTRCLQWTGEDWGAI